MSGPLDRYDTLVGNGTLDPDPAQRDAATLLQGLHERIDGYEPGRKGLFGSRPAPVEGLYLWGGVGRGKSLLMDLFFNNAPTQDKWRIHFHEFMVGIHEAIAEWRALSDDERRRRPERVRKASLDDPVPHVARAVFSRAWLICFDEFQVTDITDAMLLGRLFESLFAEGAVVVATSNRHPDDLYRDGINRELFLPFIDLLKQKVAIHELDSARDYRLEQLAGAPVYYHPLGVEADAAMDTAWQKMIAGGTEHEAGHHIRGRTLTLERTARGAARVSFEELCARALGAEDYLMLARSYHTLFMDHIPQLSPEKRNEAKRFVTFIDALYEQHTKFVCSAAAPPQALYPAGDGSFEFERTVSRLMEMQSRDYLAREHEADPDQT